MTFESKKLPGDRISSLKKILDKKGNAIGLEAHSGLSGIVVEKSAFDFVWESSLTDSASKGLPDASIVSNESRLHTIEEILNVTTKPMIVDGDTGGDEDNFRFLVKRLENQGVSAVIVEDKIFPKRNSFGGTVGAGMEDPDIFSKKLSVGMETKSTSDFLIIARLESLIAGLGMKETMSRAEKYIDSGVDGIMIHSKLKTPDEIIEFIPKYEQLCSKIGRRPYLIAVPTTYNSISDKELIDLGVDIIIHANHLSRASFQSMLDTANLISESGRSLESDENIATVKELFAAVGYDKILERDSEKTTNISAIIASAGDQSDDEKPRSLVSISGKPLAQHQIETLRKVGIEDIVIIVNDLDKFKDIENSGAKLIESNFPEEKKLLHSIMSADKYLSEHTLITYGDILFNEKIVSSLISSNEDIVIAVDSSYRYHKHNVDKKLELVSYSEKKSPNNRRQLRMSELYEVSKLGKNLDLESAEAEFIGVAYFSPKGIKDLKESFSKMNKMGTSEGLLIDILNFMIKEGIKINSMEFDGGWIELHTKDDFKMAEEELNLEY
ncbi:MAG: isocitrate lyase/phosphoenolpyruvate mutase family protein [Chloroflexota bacterium]|nr:isocitrate lyase/phosphoenolpyruvate mutase family protein [Chloroflexota bacterium]